MHLSLLGTRIWAATVPGDSWICLCSTWHPALPAAWDRSTPAPCQNANVQGGHCPEDRQCHQDDQQGHGAPPAQALGSMLSQSRVPRTLIDGEPSHAGPGLFSNPSVINDLIFGQSHLD